MPPIFLFVRPPAPPISLLPSSVSPVIMATTQDLSMKTMKYCAMVLVPALATVLTAHSQIGPQNNYYLAKTVWETDPGGPVATASIAAGPDNRIYVVDPETKQVRVYGMDGTALLVWGYDQDPGNAFYSPKGITVDHRGLVYVTDSGNTSAGCDPGVFVFQADGTFVRRIGAGLGEGDGEFLDPRDVAVTHDVDIDGDGVVDPDSREIYVRDFSGPPLQVFDVHGNFLRRISEWGGALFQLSKSGTWGRTSSMDVAPNGDCYVTNAKKIKVFDRDGAFQRSWDPRPTASDPNGYGRPVSVRVGPSGLVHVLVTAASNGPREKQHAVYSPDGTPLSETQITPD